MKSSNDENGFLPTTGEKNTWKMLIDTAIKDNRLRGSTCPAYSPQMASENRNENNMCRCGQLLIHHDLEHVFQSESTMRRKAQLHTFVNMSAKNGGSLGNNARVCSSFIQSARKTESLLQCCISFETYYTFGLISCLVHSMFSRLARYTWDTN